MGYSITLEDAPAWVDRLGVKLKAAARKGLLSAGEKIVSHIKADVIPREPRMPVDKRTYENAWRAEPTEYGALVRNDAPHAGPIEKGVRAANVKPGAALIKALTSWVLRKGLVGHPRGKIARAAADAQAKSIAWAIVRSMQKRGIFDDGKGLRILEKAMKRAPQFVREEVKRELDRVRGGR
jgi:hypothetical protein